MLLSCYGYAAFMVVHVALILPSSCFHVVGFMLTFYWLMLVLCWFHSRFMLVSCCIHVGFT